jgi:hypothetical protein
MGLTTEHFLHATAGGLVLVVWTVLVSATGTALAVRRNVA